MSKLPWNEKEKLELLASLEALLGCMKSLQATVGAVMAEVGAIRNTLFEDPEEMAVYRANLRLAAATAKPLVDEALNSYDDLLQDIVNSTIHELASHFSRVPPRDACFAPLNQAGPLPPVKQRLQRE